ncbi:MAG: PaaI family thioesterase [Terracidiphilus sp.]
MNPNHYPEFMEPVSDQHLTPFAHAAHNRCFGCGPANSTGLRLEFFLAPDGSVVSLPVVSDTFSGHPGYLHGGIIATLLDEAMSKAVRAVGRMSMTRRMEIDYLRPVPSGVPIRIEGHVTRSAGRKHWAESRILDGTGKLLAQGTGLFIEIPDKPKS